MCKAYRFDSLSGLEIDTWCGNVDSNDSPIAVCDIDDLCRPKHYVQIRNAKVVKRKVLIKATSQRSRARFEGDSSIVISEVQWTAEVTISGRRGLDIERMSDVTIAKKSLGNDR